MLGFRRDKITRLFSELKQYDLVERKRQGLGKPSIIYPKKFHAAKTDFLMSEIQTSGERKSRLPDTAKTDTNDTDINDTHFSDTYLSFGAERLEADVREQIEYDVLYEKLDDDRLDELVNIITQVMSTRSTSISIGGQEYSAEYVRYRFSKLRSHHIEYVFDRMEASTAKVKNISSYLMAALFNATATTENYWRAEVNHDMAPAVSE